MPTNAEWLHERNSWTQFNRHGAFASPLRLASGGSRHGVDGTLHTVGTGGTMWSMTTRDGNSWHVWYSADGAGIDATWRSAGASVRCVLH